ncbi:MAG: transposase [Deltaproteobacteria bacterium]|nr:MAG: transposase [Deltaproteobacteria bacterium]
MRAEIGSNSGDPVQISARNDSLYAVQLFYDRAACLQDRVGSEQPPKDSLYPTRRGGALRNLDRAFANFFRRVKEKKAGKKIQVGFPRFKSKKNGLGSFRRTGAIHVFEDAIQLPRLGLLRLKERGYLPVDGVKVFSATVSERAGRWFVSIQVEISLPDPAHSPAFGAGRTAKPVAGVDLGILALATFSDGTRVENPRALKSSLRKIKRLQRTVSRRQKGSANRRKAVHRLAKAHFRVANIRKDTLHQATSLLAKTRSVVVLET